MTKPKRLRAHPVAELFPMLAEDELREMAADIAQRGLLQAIMLDQEGQILDGRNRHAACEIAGVEPRFETYDGDDPAGYALAVNLARRSLTKGQSAMIAARARLVSSQTTRQAASQIGVSQQRINQANVVLEFAPDLADGVVVGTRKLDAAYETARQRKQDAQGDDAKLAEVRKDFPELADKVTEEELSLQAALTEAQERRAAKRRDIEQAQSAAESIVASTRSAVTALLIARKHGVDLVNKEMVGALYAAIGSLEEA